MIQKVISGGQTGVDQLGLQAAKALGIPTGGTAPLGFWTEAGAEPELGKEFGLVEGPAGYTNRTLKNVLDSDGTILFGDLSSPGSKMTIGFLKQYEKPYLENPGSVDIMQFCEHYGIRTINVAGNRGSKLTEESKTEIYATLEYAFKIINEL